MSLHCTIFSAQSEASKVACAATYHFRQSGFGNPTGSSIQSQYSDAYNPSHFFRSGRSRAESYFYLWHLTKYFQPAQAPAAHLAHLAQHGLRSAPPFSRLGRQRRIGARTVNSTLATADPDADAASTTTLIITPSHAARRQPQLLGDLLGLFLRLPLGSPPSPPALSYFARRSSCLLNSSLLVHDMKQKTNLRPIQSLCTHGQWNIPCFVSAR